MKMTNAEMVDALDGMSSKMVETVRGYVDKVKDAIGARVEAVEKAVAALPTREELKGEPGAPGASVTMEDVRPLLVEAIACIEIPKGEPGQPGGPGAPGEPGTPGKDIDPETVRAMVREEVRSIPVPRDGKDCDMAVVQTIVDAAVKAAVADFRDGEDGRDAAELEILPAIAEGKRYARGTWARYGGGLVRSFRDTSPLEGDALQEAGWDVMVNGVREFALAQGDDLRTFIFGIRNTDGTLVDQKFSLPVVIDRGVFKSGADYCSGDAVSWDGSLWIAQEPIEKAEDKPQPPLWRLSVKRGQNGKDAGSQHVRPPETLRLR